MALPTIISQRNAARRPSSTAASRRRGLTLIEMLVSVALTLLVVLAVVRVFDLLGGNVTESRSILELSGQLRNVSAQLQKDLDRITVRTLPPADGSSSEGYLEIIEGPRSDRDSDGDTIINPMDNDPTPFAVRVHNGTNALPNEIVTPEFHRTVAKILGDTDDMLMATIRSTGKPFKGKILGEVYESPLAEVVWWIQPVQPAINTSTAPGAVGLAIHRRVFLIRPDLNPLVAAATTFSAAGPAPETIRQFLADNDISVRPTERRLVANSLQDLSQRENRFAHWPTNFLQLNPTAFPFLVNRDWLIPASDRRDVMIGDALAFDIRVYDRSAPLFQPTANSPYVVSPADPGFATISGTAQPAGTGAYVDLGYSVSPNPISHFSAIPNPRSQVFPGVGFPRVYCTWTTQYEKDGIDQDRDNLIDEGTNGLDDPNNDGTPGGIDGVVEQETSAPYPIPLRGIEVLLRVQEFSSQQIRQASVVGDFLPE